LDPQGYTEKPPFNMQSHLFFEGEDDSFGNVKTKYTTIETLNNRINRLEDELRDTRLEIDLILQRLENL